MNSEKLTVVVVDVDADVVDVDADVVVVTPSAASACARVIDCVNVPVMLSPLICTLFTLSLFTWARKPEYEMSTC